MLPARALPFLAVLLEAPPLAYAVAVPELTCAECGRGEPEAPGRFLAFRSVEADRIASLDEVETFGVVVLCRPCAEREGLSPSH